MAAVNFCRFVTDASIKFVKKCDGHLKWSRSAKALSRPFDAVSTHKKFVLTILSISHAVTPSKEALKRLLSAVTHLDDFQGSVTILDKLGDLSNSLTN